MNYWLIAFTLTYIFSPSKVWSILSFTSQSALTLHQICMEKATIIAKEDNLTKCRVREKIEIKMNLDCLDRDEGKKLSDS